MADVFFKEIEPSDFSLKTASVSVYRDDGTSPHEYAAHAINSHDELVAEVERLRGAINDAFIDGCQVGWDMTGEGYNAEYGGPDNGRLHEEFSAIFAERYDDN